MKEKVTVKKINFTIVIFTISIIVFILDFFILLQDNTIVFSINHLILGNNWGILTEYGRLNGADIFAGQWWRLITSIFLHAGIPHLIVNMIALLIVGFIVEEKIGSKRYVITFMGSGIISALFTMTHTNGAVGASGAIYGIIGAMMVIFAKESSYIVCKMSLIKWILLILYLILPNLSGIVTIIAHISGLFSGIIITLFMYSFFKITVTHINKKDHYSQ
ncbi:MAG: rhomboid family intramembrane serine protease [Bacilli bacterium]